MRFSNSVAIITGGARGIGKAVATRMAAEGASIVIADIMEDAAKATVGELESAGRMAVAWPLDVTDPAQVSSMVHSVVQRFGRIDVLVNGAGILGEVVSVQEMSEANWHRVIAVNLHGVFNCSRAVVPVMLAQKRGRIVSLSSVAGKEGNPRQAAYSVSKAGVIALTKSLGKELATDGITVNCVTPALIDTEMIMGHTPEERALYLSKIPLGRVGTAEEVAAVICFLASEEASFVTGAVYDISGGRSDY